MSLVQFQFVAKSCGQEQGKNDHHEERPSPGLPAQTGTAGRRGSNRSSPPGSEPALLGLVPGPSAGVKHANRAESLYGCVKPPAFSCGWNIPHLSATLTCAYPPVPTHLCLPTCPHSASQMRPPIASFHSASCVSCIWSQSPDLYHS